MSASTAQRLESRADFQIRQTHLRFLEECCPAGAYALAVERREGPRYAGAERGSAIHDVFARYVTHLWRSERLTDWEAADRIAREVLRDYPTLSFDERRDVLEQAKNIADGYVLEPYHHYGSEETLDTVLDIGQGRTVLITGRLDLLELYPGEGRARITDAKSNHQIISDSRVREDFQLAVYALLVLRNLPQIDVVEGRLWFTRYNVMLPQRGEAIWTREDADELAEHLSRKLDAFFAGRLQHVYVPGTWCRYCPRRRPKDCARWRRYDQTSPPPLQTFYQARRAAARVIALEQERDVLLESLKAYVNEHGPVQVGDTTKAEVFDFHVSESEIFDAGEFLEVVRSEEVRSVVGDVDLSALLTVNRRARGFAKLRHHKDLVNYFDDIATTKVSTRFGHEGVSDD